MFIVQSANVVKVVNVSEQECGSQRMKASNVCMDSGRPEDETPAGELMLKHDRLYPRRAAPPPSTSPDGAVADSGGAVYQFISLNVFQVQDAVRPVG